jgi:hypothetical protein
MSNEEIIEELLMESFRLGILDRVLELQSDLSLIYDRCTSYQKAFEIAISENEFSSD